MTKFTDKSFTVGPSDRAAAQRYRDNYDRIFAKAMAPDDKPVAEHAICGDCGNEGEVFATEGYPIHACAGCTHTRRTK